MPEIPATHAAAQHLELWVESQSDYLYNYALRHFPDNDIAQELVQETFLAAVEGFERFKGEASPRTWLTSILRFKIIDRIRLKSRENPLKLNDEQQNEMTDFFDEVEHWHPEVGPLPWNIDPESIASQKQFMTTLDSCLQKLPERHRHIFLMREIDELEQEDICHKMTVSPTNLRAILCRARVNLRECLHTNWFKTVKSGGLGTERLR